MSENQNGLKNVVKLADKFKLSENQQEQFLRAATKSVVEAMNCAECGKKPKFRYAWGSETIPHGYQDDVVWCCKRCYAASVRKFKKAKIASGFSQPSGEESAPVEENSPVPEFPGDAKL